jgi:hypothetical protein
MEAAAVDKPVEESLIDLVVLAEDLEPRAGCP